jgi:tetratricopeptide (TPR) repeat protein
MSVKPKTYCGVARAHCLVWLAVFGLLQSVLGVETNSPSSTDAGTVASRDFLRSSLQIQDELRDTQLAIEKIRQESAATSASNAAVMEERWQGMQQAAANERLEQLSGIAHLDRTILIAAGAFAFLGFLVLLAGFLQWTAVNRLAAAASNLSVAHGPPGLGAIDNLLPPAHALEQSNLRFLALMERLEQRLNDMETLVKPAHTLPETPNHALAGETSPPGAVSKIAMINILLSKSQTLLKLDKAEASLASADEVLAMDPDNADALVKKGLALERLQRIPEALGSYDRAIAADDSMIMAYLQKAGLLNRLDRHSEALACYEQALKPGKVAKLQTSPLNKPPNSGFRSGSVAMTTTSAPISAALATPVA